MRIWYVLAQIVSVCSVLEWEIISIFTKIVNFQWIKTKYLRN